MYDTRRNFEVSTLPKIANMMEEIAIFFGAGLICAGQFLTINRLILKFRMTPIVLGSITFVSGGCMVLFYASMRDFNFGVYPFDLRVFSLHLTMIVSVVLPLVLLMDWRVRQKRELRARIVLKKEEYEEEKETFIMYCRWLRSRYAKGENNEA